MAESLTFFSLFSALDLWVCANSPTAVKNLLKQQEEIWAPSWCCIVEVRISSNRPKGLQRQCQACAHYLRNNDITLLKYKPKQWKMSKGRAGHFYTICSYKLIVIGWLFLVKSGLEKLQFGVAEAGPNHLTTKLNLYFLHPCVAKIHRGPCNLEFIIRGCMHRLGVAVLKFVVTAQICVDFSKKPLHTDSVAADHLQFF